MDKAFVILLHRLSDSLHYDFLLEAGPMLTAFRLPAPLDQLPAGQEIIVPRLDDHRRIYLTYEGEISGGRGTVSQVESGTYEAISADAEPWVIHLAGRGLRGVVQLRPVGPREYGLTWQPQE